MIIYLVQLIDGMAFSNERLLIGNYVSVQSLIIISGRSNISSLISFDMPVKPLVIKYHFRTQGSDPKFSHSS